MKRRRRGFKVPELTSLLDTLFILVFAALIQSRALAERSAAEPVARPEEPSAPAPVPAPPSPPDAGLVPRDEIRAATARLVAAIGNKEVILVVVSNDGFVTSITRRWDGRTLPSEEVRINLMRPNAEFKLVYRGHEEKEQRLCAVVRRELGPPDLGRAVIVIAPDRAMREVGHILASGLQEDAASCLDDANGLGILVDPEQVAP